MNLLLAVYLVLLFSQDVSAACVNSYVVATSGTFVSPLTWCSTTAQITGVNTNSPSYSFLLTGKIYTFTLSIPYVSELDRVIVSQCSTTNKTSCVNPVTLYIVSYSYMYDWQVYITSLSTYLYFPKQPRYSQPDS